MQEDSLYEELTSCKEISQQPRLSNIFQLSTDNFSLDKVQAFLYDKFILLKFKVNIWLFRRMIKIHIGKYLSISL